MERILATVSSFTILSLCLTLAACGGSVCDDAADAMCGCATLPESVQEACDAADEEDPYYEDESECEGEAETAAQCLVDNETAYCDYMADLADDPSATVAEDYENAYLDNCL